MPKLPHQNPDHSNNHADDGWKPGGADPAVDEDHEIPVEDEPKQPAPTPMPAD